MATTYAQPLFNLGTVPRKQLDLSQVAKAPVNAGMTGQAAILDRLNPLLQQQRSQSETQWLNQGLRPGGEAYDNAANLLGQQENDARTQAILQGLNLDMSANQQGFGQALDSGNFENSAAGQGFNQNLAGQQFGYQQFADQRGIDAAESNSKMSGLFGLGTSIGVPLATKALGGLFGGGGGISVGGSGGDMTRQTIDTGKTVGQTVGTNAGKTAATGIAAKLGLGGGSGLFGLGASTIPVLGGLVAGGILASKLVGRGRKAADKITGPGGLQYEFEQALNQIDSQGLPPEQAWAAKQQEYQTLLQLGMEHAQKGSQQAKVIRQMFDKISPLFGQQNPLAGARA